MVRVKRVFVLVHIVLWVLFCLLAMLQLSQGNPSWPTLTAGVILTSLFVFYSQFFLLTHYSGKRKRAAYLLRLAGVLVTGPFIYILFHHRRPDTYDLLSEHFFISLLSIVIPFTFVGWLARVTQNLVVNTVKKEQLEKQAVEAELYYLKSQINPHFLFNTLNNIHTLVYKQAAAAPDAVMQLASLMRYMIYESNAPTVPLAREMAYLQDYVGLQQLRYRQGPVVDLKIEGAIESSHIAPLLFIHLLENAYKHSPARLAPGDIRVQVVVKEGDLTFSVHNPVGNSRVQALHEPSGIGLPNVRKRLALLYPGQHTFTVDHTSETFTAALTIHGLQSQPHASKAHLLYH